jgi:hypothetical protein
VIDWAVPWTSDQVIDLIFLGITCFIVSSVPLVYGLRANWRDPLARAVVIGTGGTALALCATFALTVALHAGWNPPEVTIHWVARGLYFAISIGKLTLLLALLRAMREIGVSRNSARISGRTQIASRERIGS